MGRYYNTTATPQFVEGMYTPPWELINKVLEANQQGYENVLTTTNLFNDIDIQHIEDPIIKEQAQKLKDYYTGRAEDITKAIQKDPTAWRKANPEIQNLARELDKDVKSGEISRLNQQYQSLASFVKEHEQYKKDHPEDYNRALSYFMQDFQSDPLRRKAFNWFQLAKPVDDTKFKEGLLKLKASSVERTTKDGYIVGTEGVPREQIEAYTRSFLSNPENKAYIQQQIRFKNPDYYDAELERLHPETGGYFEELKVDSKTGRTLTDEEVILKEKNYLLKKEAYEKLSDEKKKKVSPPLPDYQIKKGAVSKYIDDAVSTASYTKNTLKEDPVKAQARRLNQEMAIAKMNNTIRLQEMSSREMIANSGQALDSLKSLQTSMKSILDLKNPVTGELSLEDSQRLGELKAKEKEILNGLLGIGTKAIEDNQAFKVEPFSDKKSEFSIVPKQKEEWVDTGSSVRSVTLNPPKNLYDLFKSDKDDYIHRDLRVEFENLYNSNLSKIIDTSDRFIAKDFIKYLQSITSSSNGPVSKDVNELVRDYAEVRNPMDKSFKNTVNFYPYDVAKKQKPVIDKRNSIIRSLRKNVLPFLKTFEDNHTSVKDKDSDTYNAEVYPLTPDVSKKLTDEILNNPLGWNIYPRDAKTGGINTYQKPISFDSGTMKNLLQHGAKASHAVNATLPKGSSSSAILIRDGRYEYTAIPITGTQESFVKGTLLSNASYKNKPTSYERFAANPLANEIYQKFQVADTISKGDIVYKAINIPREKSSGERVNLKIIQTKKGREEPKYNFFIDNIPVLGRDIEDIFDVEEYDKESNTVGVLKEGIASKIEKYLK